MSECGKIGREIQLGGLSEMDNPPESHNTREQIAEELGWSSTKVARADVVWKQAPEEVKEAIKAGGRY